MYNFLHLYRGIGGVEGANNGLSGLAEGGFFA